jgi:hypothetical protein
VKDGLEQLRRQMICEHLLTQEHCSLDCTL